MPAVTAGECPITFVGEKWAKPPCRHATCKAVMSGLRTFTRQVGPEKAVGWVNIGLTRRAELDEWTRYRFDTPEDAAPWKAAGISAEDAINAHRDGFNVDDAVPWLEQLGGWGVVRGFMQDAAFEPEEAGAWFRVGAYGSAARTARAAGFTPEKAVEFIAAAGIDPTAAGMLEYCRYRTPELAGRWHRTGIYLHGQRQWAEGGWEPEDALAWHQLGVKAEDAAALVEAGVSPGDLVALGKPVATDKQYLWDRAVTSVTATSRHRMSDWTGVLKEVGPEEASRWEALGVDTSFALGAASWGVTAADVGALRERGAATAELDGFTVVARWGNGKTSWSMTPPDGADLESERIAAAFTGQKSAGDRLLEGARRFSRYTATPGEALRWAALDEPVEVNWLRDRLRTYPLTGVDPKWGAPDMAKVAKPADGGVPVEKRRQAAQALRLLRVERDSSVR